MTDRTSKAPDDDARCAPRCCPCECWEAAAEAGEGVDGLLADLVVRAARPRSEATDVR